MYALLNEVAIGAGDRPLAAEARGQRDSLKFDKLPYDPWYQSLWPRCYDTVRLTSLATADALYGQADRAREVLSKAVELSNDESLATDEYAALLGLLESN